MVADDATDSYCPIAPMQALFTIGYEGSDIDQVIDTLLESGVDQLADIRQLPLSRKWGFSKVRLAGRLSDAGVGYTHWPALGAPKSLRDALRGSKDYAAFFKEYRSHLQRQADTLAELALLPGSVALLCFEHDAGKCHRGVVAEQLEPRIGRQTTHLIPLPARQPR